MLVQVQVLVQVQGLIFPNQGEVLRQTRTYKEIAGLSYEDFLDYIQDLNEISRYFTCTCTLECCRGPFFLE